MQDDGQCVAGSSDWATEQEPPANRRKGRPKTISGPLASQERLESDGRPPLAPLPENQRRSDSALTGRRSRVTSRLEAITASGDNWEDYWGSEYAGQPQPEAEAEPEQQPQPDPEINNRGPPEKRGFFKTARVEPLNEGNYDDFIQGMEKSLVMFYNPFQCESVFPGLEFGNAADRTFKGTHRFASVDCSVEKALCLRENVLKTPQLKLYSNGFSLSTVRDVASFNADQMQMLIVMTPILHQPRQELGIEYLARE